MGVAQYYDTNPNVSWQDGMVPNKRILIIDEYNPLPFKELPLSTINSICDGTYEYLARGRLGIFI
jgi:hypothetical protein